MKLNLGENIRQNRRRLDLTQDEVAERLGTTYQSVSRWENGTTYPDMELLPELAAIFGITVDRLLGYEDEVLKREAERYLADFKTAINHGRVDDCIKIARAGVEAFPNDYALLNNLMYALFIAGDDDGGDPDWHANMEKYDAEIVSLGERIVKYCPDEEIRMEAKTRLAFEHAEMGRKAVARQIYETLPSFESCREANIRWALEGEERAAHNIANLRRAWGWLRQEMWNRTAHVPDEDKVKIFDAIRALDSLILGSEERIGGCHWDEYRHLCDKAAALARLGRREEMFEALRNAVCEADAFDRFDGEESMETVLIGTYTQNRGEIETDDPRTAKERMRERDLQNAAFDPYRDSDDFRGVIGRLS